MMKTSRLVMGMLMVSLSACSAIMRERPMPGDPAYAPVPPPSMTPVEGVSGSIFQPSRNFSVYGDKIAFNEGDVLSILLDEKTQSSKKAETNFSKDSDIKSDEGPLFGTMPSFGNLSLETALKTERSFDGSAESEQNNSLSGSIAVTVAEVLPNGLLRVRGEKWLTLNQGEEFIRVTGLVRPEDIAPDNSVSSRRIADARISYGGTGDFDQTNRQGWGDSFLNSEWWPF